MLAQHSVIKTLKVAGKGPITVPLSRTKEGVRDKRGTGLKGGQSAPVLCQGDTLEGSSADPYTQILDRIYQKEWSLWIFRNTTEGLLKKQRWT